MTACCSKVKHRDLVILASASVIRLLMAGLWFTPGILYVAFRDEFRYSAGVTSWITALQYFTSCITCAVGGLLVRRCGSRLVTMVGGLIMVSGLLTSMLATHIVHVFITFGVLSGLGSGLSYIGSLEALNVQLTTHRHILFGICAFAGNMGIVIYPTMLQGLINAYTWRGMFLVIGGIELNIIVVAILFPGRTKHTKNGKTSAMKPCQDRISNSQPDNDGPARTLLPEDCDEKETSLEEREIMNSTFNKTSADIQDRTALYRDAEKNETNFEIEILSENMNDQDFSNEHGLPKKLSFLQRQTFLKNRHYYLYLISGTLLMFGSGIILGHLSAFAILNNLTDKMGASTLYIVNAMSMATTKLLHGFAISNNRLEPVTVHIILTGICGLMTLIFLLDIPLPVLYLYTVAFGAGNSCIGGALLPAITVAMSGGDNFAFALGVCVLVTALGSLTGAPTAGWIYDVTQSYTVPFLVASIAMTSSSVVMIVSYFLKKPCSVTL